MSTGTDIVHAALRRIGAHSIAAPADPEAIIIGRDMLNGMLHQWLSIGIDIGFTPLDAPGDPLSEPPDCRQPIIDNLATRLAPEFDNGKNVVSDDLRINARMGYNFVNVHYRVTTIPDKIVSSTLPSGVGNRDIVYSRNFVGRGASLNADNG